MGRFRSEKRKRKLEKRKSHKKDAKSGNMVFFQICGPGASKSRLAKAADAEPSDQMRDRNLHAFVEGSTFPSQNVQSTPFSDNYWNLRC